MSLPKDIASCLSQIIGEECDFSLQTSRLRSGARVYRFAGTQGLEYRAGKIFYCSGKEDIELTSENLEAVNGQLRKQQPTDHRFWGWVARWEILVLKRGPEQVRQELEDALREKGHAIEVKVGGSRSDYPTSIAVKQLAAPLKPGTPLNGAALGELAAISDEVRTIQAAIGELSLRLRSLVIAIGDRGRT